MRHSKYRFPYFRIFYRISWHGKFYEWWELPISLALEDTSLPTVPHLFPLIVLTVAKSKYQTIFYFRPQSVRKLAGKHWAYIYLISIKID